MRSLLHGSELQNLGCAEVRNLHGVVGGRQHQVGWLNVAMHDVALMCKLQRAAGLFHDAQQSRYRKRMSVIQQGLHAFAFHQFHGDEVQTVFFSCVVNHYDVGMGK